MQPIFDPNSRIKFPPIYFQISNFICASLSSTGTAFCKRLKRMSANHVILVTMNHVCSRPEFSCHATWFFMYTNKQIIMRFFRATRACAVAHYNAVLEVIVQPIETQITRFESFFVNSTGSVVYRRMPPAFPGNFPLDADSDVRFFLLDCGLLFGFCRKLYVELDSKNSQNIYYNLSFPRPSPPHFF